MLWERAESNKLVAAIRTMAQAATSKELDAVVEIGKLRKPHGFDEHVIGLARRYDGDQASILKGVLEDRYPNTHAAMPCAPLPWLEFIATQDAGVYEEQPERALYADGDDGDKLPPDDDRQKRFARLCERADLPVQMPELERRVLIPCPQLVHVGWVKASRDDPGRPVLSMYWPSDVIVINHWSAPADPTLDLALVVAVRQASPDVVSGGDWWWVWSRDHEDVYEGDRFIEPGFKAWSHVFISRDGKQRSTTAKAQDYEGKLLPFFLAQVGVPRGSPFVDRHRDIKHSVDELNVMAANEQHTVDMQAHGQAWTDSQDEKDGFVIGPDRAMRVRPGSNVGVLNFDPKLEDMRESRKLRARELASARGNSPDAYTTEPGPPQSGVSREIQNRPHESKLNTLRHVFQSVENRKLLPILLDVAETFDAPENRIGAGVRAQMNPRRPRKIEDPEMRQRRMLEARDASWISDARAATESDLYPSVDDAKKAGLSDELKKAPAPAPPGAPGQAPPGSLAARLQERRAARGEEKEPPATESEDEEGGDEEA